MSLQIDPRFSGGPRVRATGATTLSMSSSGPAKTEEKTATAPTPERVETAQDPVASEGESSDTTITLPKEPDADVEQASPEKAEPAAASESAVVAASGAVVASGSVTLGRRAPKAPGGGASTLHGDRIIETAGGAAPAMSTTPTAAPAEKPPVRSAASASAGDEPAVSESSEATVSAPETTSSASRGGLSLGATRAKAPGGKATALTLGGGAAAAAADPGSSPVMEAPAAEENAGTEETAAAPTTGSAEPAAAMSEPAAEKPFVGSVGAPRSGGISLGGGSKVKAPGGGKAALALGGAAAVAGAASSEGEKTTPAEKAEGPAGSGTSEDREITSGKAEKRGTTGTTETGATSTEESADEPASEAAPAVADEAHPEVSPAAPKKAVKAASRFVAKHGGSADVVLQPTGRRGVRMTFIGADGIVGDHMVADLAEAEAVCASVAGLESSDWTRDLVSKAMLPDGHWRSMAGSGALV